MCERTLDEHQSEGTPTPGVPGTVAGTVALETFLDVQSDSRVETVVTTPEDVNVPHREVVQEFFDKTPPPEEQDPLSAFFNAQEEEDPALGPCVWTEKDGRSVHVLPAGHRRHPALANPKMVGLILDHLVPPESKILEPFAGSGTTLVEAGARGLYAAGIECEEDYARMAAEASYRYSATTTVVHGDSRKADSIFGHLLFDAVITSPPYGNMRIGGGGDDGNKNIRMPDGSFPRGSEGWKARKEQSEGYGKKENRVNLGNLPMGDVLDPQRGTYWGNIQDIYQACLRVTRPGGRFVLILRDYVKDKALVDLCGDTVTLLTRMGLRFLPCEDPKCPRHHPGREFHVPTHTRLFRIRPSLWTTHNSDRWRKDHPEGPCPYDARHESLLVFQVPTTCPPPPLGHRSR